MVIVIMGVIGGAVAVFMKSPLDAYFDTARRAGIVDVADTTVRRMARDIRKALPFSIRLLSDQCIEFIPTRTGGRYRYEEIVSGDGTSLIFPTAATPSPPPDQTFNMLGHNSDLPADQQIRANDMVAVYNLWNPGADAYTVGVNTARVSSVVDGAETIVNMAGNTTVFPRESPGKRFHVIPGDEKIVS